MTEREKENWKKIPDLLEKLGLSPWFKKCFISEKLKEDADSTVGVWDHELQKIVILRAQLKDEVELFGIVLHEIIHAKTGATDISRFFEQELTKMMGTLSACCVSNVSSTALFDSSSLKIKSGYDSDAINDKEIHNCNIDTRRIALLSISGDIHWCGDYLGLFSSFTKTILSECGLTYDDKEYMRKCALYVEDGVSYWLVYNYTDEIGEEFMYVTQFEKMTSFEKVIGEGTLYNGKEIELLRDYMIVEENGFSRRYSSSVSSTYDGYVYINREILLHLERESIKEKKNIDVWELVKTMQKANGSRDNKLENYVNCHKCTVCGCFFTSYEEKCAKCGNKIDR